MTNTEQVAFDIIATAGDGRAKVMEALKQSRKGNFGEAAELLKDADTLLLKAHQLQTDKLLTKQANGELNDPYNVVIAHAQDYVMTAMAMKDMAVEIVKLYEKVRAI
jgi:PTS system cellobiose-specific IIA component